MITPLVQVQPTITRKNSDISLVRNSLLTRLPACVMFFGCEIGLHLSRVDLSLKGMI